MTFGFMAWIFFSIYIYFMIQYCKKLCVALHQALCQFFVVVIMIIVIYWYWIDSYKYYEVKQIFFVWINNGRPLSEWDCKVLKLNQVYFCVFLFYFRLFSSWINRKTAIEWFLFVYFRCFYIKKALLVIQDSMISPSRVCWTRSSF